MVETGHGGFTIRQGRLSDVCALIGIENRCFRSYYRRHRYTTGDFERRLRDDRTLVLVAVAGHDLIGYVLGPAPVPAHPRAARVDSIAVVKPWRGSGVAKRLLESFLTQARSRGGRRVYLEVATTNRDASRLFEAAHFRPYRRLGQYYDAATDGLRMRRVLR